LQALSGGLQTALLAAGMFDLFTVSGATIKGADKKDLYSVPQPALIDDTAIAHVFAMADLRADRLAEIVDQIATVLPYFGQAVRMGRGHAPMTSQFLQAVQATAAKLTQQVKFHYSTPRPLDYAPALRPVIQTPDHSSYPSGHAAESHALAATLGLMTGQNAPFEAIADRIAQNREVAGVHFKQDSDAGKALGMAIAQAIVAACEAAPDSLIGAVYAQAKAELPDHS
jgi:hypothetical protein